MASESDDFSWQPARFPVSVKGVTIWNDQVLLLENERHEWELPGGKLEVGETPEACLIREIYEETGWSTAVGSILHSWLYHIEPADRPAVDVFVVVYGCPVLSDQPPQVSNEHKRAQLWKPSEVPGLNMPEDYKTAIAKWCTELGLE
ncbi:NUDIX hydrolase [Glycomyces sp. TRM65418]|uniref:NUDIX hydrolase n=1 Tax=Glycomyces sp. TRM65418 TaxID=2867006 RepID=UPI001CE515DB|nr:NUDIX hydrolase [Glycomyces sp. TRM65418]MCC3762594.1 NUDIX hydrolase [Glycomyces sp. TRM65418]QZD56633.1 NUDIX hydrolase [Glycomyces sp. TRM65418]